MAGGAATSALVLAVFGAVHLGMALGRWPGLGVDRTGIALLSAPVLYGGGAQDGAAVLAAIDFPTLIILFARSRAPRGARPVLSAARPRAPTARILESAANEAPS